LEAELAQINSTIATLQAKDTELEEKITTLEEYVNTELQNTEDWATATFATLEQYNTIVEDIATIKTQIETLNTSLTNLEERLNIKIATDIAAAVEGLQSELATKVTEITTAYTNAISTAKEEVTAAYTEAIATAITNLESSMKQWVNEQLTGYYTIAEIDAHIEALRELYRETGHEQLAEDIESLEGALQDMKEELTEAYQKAIEDAINTNNGVIDGKIAEEVATINSRIDNEIAAINAQIADITSRLDNVEAQISDLLSRIQSVTYVPKYSDGKATMDYASKTAEFDFIISPKSAVTELASVWNEALSIKAVYTQTRTVEFIDLPITNFEADITNGVISLTISGENLNDDFYTEQQDASAFLQISDGNSNITSEYIAMTPNYNIKFEDLNVKAICCKNWDTNSNGELSYDEASAVSDIGSTFSGNTDIMTFAEFKHFTGVVELSASAFEGCTSLKDLKSKQY
jgi:predicted  nucleic acid-binding Zn-ribbon protein